jgi:hypothetical protein
MLNNEGFVLLAGNPSKWDDEIRARCEKRGSFFESESLCKLQAAQHAKGRRSARLQRTIYGWSVRLDSGLDDRQILYGHRLGNKDLSREAAVAFGIAWANEDPEKREFYAYRDDMTKK